MITLNLESLLFHMVKDKKEGRLKEEDVIPMLHNLNRVINLYNEAQSNLDTQLDTGARH